MNGNRRAWLSRLFFWAIRCSPEQAAQEDIDQRMKRMDFETDTRRLGVRMNEGLRDRLRGKWLRLSKRVS